MASEKFRLSVVLVSGRDFILSFDSPDAAQAYAMKIVEDGCAIEDRTADSSRVNKVLHPLAQIKSFNIYEDR